MGPLGDIYVPKANTSSDLSTLIHSLPLTSSRTNKRDACLSANSHCFLASTHPDPLQRTLPCSEPPHILFSAPCLTYKPSQNIPRLTIAFLLISPKPMTPLQ